MDRLMRTIPWLIGLAFVGALLLVGSSPGEASPAPTGSLTPSLCSMRLQLRHPERCAAGGGRTDLLAMAVEGTFPERPLPAAGVDPAMGEVPFYYLKSNNDEGTELYTSLQDAIERRNLYRTVEPGFVYFSWIDRYDQDGQLVYMIAPGIYAPGSGMSRSAPSSFHGVALNRTPERPFAWVLTGTYTSQAPGHDQAQTNHWVNRYDIVWVYEAQRVNGLDWYRVGPNEWLEQRTLGIVEPDTDRPEGVPEDRWIAINLYEQTLAVYEGGKMIYATLVSSGLDGWWTQPGVFQVYARYEADPMQGAFAADRSDYYYLEDVPWILYYDEKRALHGAYWHNGFGYPRSHGCVNLSPADAHWLYEWAGEGTWVYVFDPTGETPTDPDIYGSGGA